MKPNIKWQLVEERGKQCSEPVNLNGNLLNNKLQNFKK